MSTEWDLRARFVYMYMCMYVCLFLSWGRIGSDSFILDVTKNRLHTACGQLDCSSLQLMCTFMMSHVNDSGCRGNVGSACQPGFG